MMSALADRRNGLIRLIHVAKRDRGLDDETYRDILTRATGKSSCRDMTEAELDRALRAFKATGFNVKHSRPAPKPSRPAHRLRGAQAALITALWIDLWQLGAVRDRSDKALDAFVERQAGVAYLKWLTPANANKVIEGLKDWCGREGFTLPFVPEGEDAGLAAKRALCVAIHRKLRIAGVAVEVLAEDFARIRMLTADEAERFADRMGYRLREALREIET